MRRPLGAALVIGALLLVLSACTAPGPSAPSVAAPTNLQATATDGGVHLSWTASTTAGVSEYRIYQGSSPTALTNVAQVGAGTTSYYAAGLTNGTEYHFAVDAVTSEGAASARSAAVSATPAAGTGGPVVTSTSPAADATGVGLNANINLRFSRAMDQAATEAAFSISPAVACDLTWNSAGDRLTCAPQADLTPNQAYTVAIGAGATDDEGNAILAPFTFTFTTGAAVAPACVLGSAVFGACVLGN
jgi:hypothetical protein